MGSTQRSTSTPRITGTEALDDESRERGRFPAQAAAFFAGHGVTPGPLTDNGTCYRGLVAWLTRPPAPLGSAV